MSKMSKKASAEQAQATTSVRRARPDPFRHAGTANWGKGGKYVIDADGQRQAAAVEPKKD